MLELFDDISESIQIDRTNPETSVVTRIHANIDAYVYRGRDSTELGAVIEVLSEFTCILMEASPLDIRIGDDVIRANGDKLSVTAVDNYYYSDLDIKYQRLITEKATT